MTVAHSNLTGTDLHEVKGASTATSGQVPVSNGGGSAPFAKLTHTSLQTTGNPFGGQLVHVREEQGAGVDSTTPTTAATWVNSTLNVVKTNEAGASLAGNIVTLPAGTYFAEGVVTALVQANSTTVQLKGRLQDNTGGVTLIYGQSALLYTPTTTAGIQVTAPVKGRFTLSTTSNISLDQYRSHASSGTHISVGTEVYSELLIWKVA